VGVLVGGFLVQKYWAMKSTESSLIDYLTKELNDLADETLEYWSLDCSGTGKASDEIRQDARKLEQKIKGAIKSINSTLDQYGGRYCKKVDFTPLMVEISDACTSGQFEEVNRPADRTRFLTVVNATQRVKAELFKRRV